MNSHNGYYVSYDKDGNITSVVLGGSRKSFTYDSTNKLISAGQNAYTYNAENTRVKNLCGGVETSYVYDTNAKLSKLLVKKTGTTVTKYVYGRGLIGEETSGTFRTYHFDYRGSTVALTNINGTITDTFEYDTYGKLISRTGSTKILFMYNGRDGVVTDDNGLIYMRARYYSPELRRFVNADVLVGDIADSTSLNRYSYVNGDPVSYVDPTGYIGVLTLMLIGAGIGAACSFVGSFVSQSLESKANGEEFKPDWGEILLDTAWGAIDGAISFSPLGLTGKAVGGIITSFGSSVTDELTDDEKGLNVTRVAQSMATDILLDSVLPDFADDINISKAYKSKANVIKEMSARGNNKWANKQITRQNKNFKNLLNTKVYGDVTHGFISEGAAVVCQETDNFLDDYISLPKYLDEGFVIKFSRK